MANHPDSVPRLRVDWGDAPAIPLFCGREQEQAQLTQWIVQERCRVVGILGMGGIGKSALLVSMMYQLAEHFEVVIFRSLRDAPACEVLLDDCLQMLSPQSQELQAQGGQAQGGQAQGTVPTERRLSLLQEHLRKTRALVILDNMEGLLEEGDIKGHFRPGFEGYGQLLHRVSEIGHQSCLLFTSREKPSELRLLEGRYSQVHSLHLAGLDVANCKQILEDREVMGTSAERENLIAVYGGNPLALKIVAETIVDLFGGQIGLFLAESSLVFGNIINLLEGQIARLSALEQCVHYWLAIAREPMTIDELQALLVVPLPRGHVLAAVDSLRRRSLIETGKRRGSFTLQSVVLEYVTSVLIAEGSREIQQGRLDKLTQYGLSQAHAKEYVRQTQERLLLSPLLADLQNAYWEGTDGARQAYVGGEDRPQSPPVPMASVEEQLLVLLEEFRKQDDAVQGYGPANLIALLRLQRGHLSGLDLSHLCIRGAYLQSVQMQDVSMAGALICDSVFTQAVSVAQAVAISRDGNLWAVGSLQGKIRVWEGGQSQELRLVWQAHADTVQSLTFSPDGRSLASGSTDGTVKLWDVSGQGTHSHATLLWTGWQECPFGLAFSPDGSLFASGGMDATVQLWDVQSGINLQTLVQTSHVFAIVFSPDGSLLASSCLDGELCLWERQRGTDPTFVSRLAVRTNWVLSLAFAPDGKTLASTGRGERTVKLWEVASLRLLRTLPGHTDRSRCVAWSPDGSTLAYGSADKAIWLWDVEQGRCRAVLRGHSTDVYGLAFTPDGTRLLSGSADSTLRVWDVVSNRCVRVMQGYGVCLYDLAWSPDGKRLISGGSDALVTVWDTHDGMSPVVLRGHSWIVSGVGWSPDGRYLSSGGWDAILCLWDPTTYTCIQRFEDPKVVLLSMAWSPNGHLLACGTYQWGIRVWDVTTRSLCCVEHTHSTTFNCIAWSPNGKQLAGGGEGGCIYLWESADDIGQLQDRVPVKLLGHRGWIRDVEWSPDGNLLASASGDGGRGELFVWDVQTCGGGGTSPGTPLSVLPMQTFVGYAGVVSALAWCSRRDGTGPYPHWLISGDCDGVLCWWDVLTGECVNRYAAHRGTIHALKVSPDGRRLASCGDDGAIMIWNLERFEHLNTFRHDRPYERLNITNIRGLNDAQKESLQALGAFEEDAL